MKNTINTCPYILEPPGHKPTFKYFNINNISTTLLDTIPFLFITLPFEVGRYNVQNNQKELSVILGTTLHL